MAPEESWETTAAPRPTETRSATPLLELDGLRKSFGSTAVLGGISLDVRDGELVSLLGETGSGKTTILRLIGGFERPDQGEIRMNGERIDHLPPNRRRVNTVFQNYALFPHLSVFENIAYGLRAKRVPKPEIQARVEKVLALVRMSALAARRPNQLSGGQQQRVALARALVNQPQVLLLDEPLSALDANLRRQVQEELKAVQRNVGIAFVFVTHDQDEATFLSDRVALLRGGLLEQVDAPRRLYEHPRTVYAARFFGQTNLLRAAVSGGVARSGGLVWRCRAPDGPAIFSLRPESIRLSAGQQADPAIVRFRAAVERRRFERGTELLDLLLADGRTLLARLRGAGDLPSDLELEFSVPEAILVEDSEG